MYKQMSKFAIGVVIGAVAIAQSIHAEIPPTISLEYAIETSTQSTIMPSNLGSWRLTQCTECTPITLQLNNETKFFVGSTPVSLAALNQFVHSGGPYSMTVLCKTDQNNVVTRIVVSGQLNTAKGT